MGTDSAPQRFRVCTARLVATIKPRNFDVLEYSFSRQDTKGYRSFRPDFHSCFGKYSVNPLFIRFSLDEHRCSRPCAKGAGTLPGVLSTPFRSRDHVGTWNVTHVGKVATTKHPEIKSTGRVHRIFTKKQYHNETEN